MYLNETHGGFYSASTPRVLTAVEECWYPKHKKKILTVGCSQKHGNEIRILYEFGGCGVKNPRMMFFWDHSIQYSS